MKILDSTCEFISQQKLDEERHQYIMKIKVEDIPDILLSDERNLPSDPFFVQTGWSNKMIMRYSIAMLFKSKGRRLDTCSGLGWGAYILDGNDRITLGIDYNMNAIKFAQNQFPLSGGYINGDVLNIPFKSGTFDLVTAMESIEHFTMPEISKYLGEIFRVLRWRGVFFGSSAFPETRHEAIEICKNNNYHKYILTRKELKKILKKTGFRVSYIFSNRLYFFAWKI